MENELNTDLNWGTAKKTGFRFCFIFFLLFIALENNGAYPLWGLVMYYPGELINLLMSWIGKHVLNISYAINLTPNGSGDTTLDYIIVFTIFVSAVFGTLIWSVLDRKRPHYQTLYYYLTAAIRFYVGLMLISYGLIKIVKLQFPSPELYRLTQNYGDSSPMGLAWTFLGFSDGYNLFMGIAEVASILLLFRRTMTAGAIITLMTTMNVMAMNYFYDVPVKLLSSALVLMTLFLLMHDAGNLIKFFFSGKPISLPVIQEPELKKRWLRISKMGIKFSVIGFAVLLGTYQAWSSKTDMAGDTQKSRFYGLYLVNTFVINNDTLPPLTTDTVRWNQLVIEDEEFMRLRFMSDSVAGFYSEIDTVSREIALTLRNDSTVKCLFSYQQPNNNCLNLKGTIKGDSVSLLMTKKAIKDIKSFRLMRRGFNWINESPYNR